ncbi:MAG: hypothetical protein KBD83_00525 [Gammaproteobacteria bacterium]|nr:hypothetical protein [Gammaproteobacteria bacterium]
MRKKLLYSLIVGLACFHVASVYSNCSSSPCGGKKISRNSKPITPGCETLKVTIQNNTNFSFVVDNNYNPDQTIGETTNFGDVAAHSTEVFSIKGVNLDNASQQDEVDTSIRYIAKHENSETGAYDENTGAQFTITLKKISCNSAVPTMKMDDHKCYYASRICDVSHCYWNSCTAGAPGGCDGGNHTCPLTDDVKCHDEGPSGYDYRTPDDICGTYYDTFHSLDCKTASTDPSVGATLAQASKVELTSGLYSVGVTLSDDDGQPTDTENPSVHSTTYSNFTCNQSSECGNDSCGGGTDEYNKPAQLVFHVYPSPIETLTLTFPFNAQSPIAKLMSTTIYSNLSPKNLGGLGTYYSMTPVVVTDTTLAFSTLCNSASCPQPE